MKKTDVIVVGAGHNGLVAATYLARAGLKVMLLERKSFVGGAALTEELWPGYHFSTCAHLIHAIHPKIMRDFDLERRGLKWVETPPTIYIRDDGTYYGPKDHDSPRNLLAPGKQSKEEVESEKRYEDFKASLNRIFAPYRLQTPPTLEELLQKHQGSPEEKVLQTAVKTSLIELHEQFLHSPAQLDQYAWEGAPFGRNPNTLCLAYNSIEEPEDGNGIKPATGYVRGGMGELSRMLRECAEEAGVTIRCDSTVEKFLTNDGKVCGVKLEGGEEIKSTRVVSNLDPKRTFLKLTPEENLDSTFTQGVQSLASPVSCLKLLAVVNELPDWKAWDGDPKRIHEGAVRLGVSRQNISSTFDQLEAGQPPSHPVMSVNFPSYKDPSLTKPGHHTASVWIFPAPAHLNQGTWDDAREEVTENLIDRITEYAPNFRKSILHRKLRTPQDLERENSLTDGCIWHVQHDGEHLFWNRPLPELSNYRAPIKGLYLSGAGQHPGGEVSGIPGHNAAHELLKDI